jgi:hypothetical protein
MITPTMFGCRLRLIYRRGQRSGSLFNRPNENAPFKSEIVDLTGGDARAPPALFDLEKSRRRKQLFERIKAWWRQFSARPNYSPI